MAVGALAHRRRRSCRRDHRHRRPRRRLAGKPVGLVHFAAAARDGRITHREQRFGAIGRSDVRRRSVVEALRMLIEVARGPKPPPRSSAKPPPACISASPAPRRVATKRPQPKRPVKPKPDKT